MLHSFPSSKNNIFHTTTSTAQGTVRCRLASDNRMLWKEIRPFGLATMVCLPFTPKITYFHYCALVSSGKKLGRGAFATVYLGQHKYTGEPVAIKVVDLERLSTNNKKLKKHLESEIEIMNSLKHENIVLQHDVIVVRSSFPPLPLSSSHKLWLTLISD